MSDFFGLVGCTVENRYKVEGVVGEGGFGVVYRALNVNFRRHVALKCLKLPVDFGEAARAAFIERFRDEGRLMLTLSEQNPGIVRVYDFGAFTSQRGETVPYLVLEWLEGETLEQALERRLATRNPFSEQEAIALLNPAMEALAFAHGGGSGQVIAHRDIKPENLFIKRDGSLKLLDFGIAKAMEEGAGVTMMNSRTASGFSAFSPHYGAPEQFRPKQFGQTGPWTDVHALGLVMSHLVSGRTPLRGDSFVELLDEATATVRPTPRQLGAQVSEGFERVCARALSLDPRQRQRDASILLEDLRTLVPVSAANVRAAPVMAPAAPVAPGDTTSLRLTRSGMVASLALALVLTVLGAVSSVRLYQRNAVKPVEGQTPTGALSLPVASVAPSAIPVISPDPSAGQAMVSVAVSALPVVRPTLGPGQATASAVPAQTAAQSGGSVASGKIGNAADVIARARARARTCYQQGLGASPDMEGRASFTLSVNGSGKVLNASVVPSGSLSPSVASCIRGALLSLSFDPPEGGGAATVSGSFLFVNANKGP